MNNLKKTSSSQARMGVIGVAALGVFANSIAVSSCDLLRYDEGSLGLMHYVDEQTGVCTAFVALEDESLKTAQSASLGAFALGVVFFAISTAQEFQISIPFQNALLTACAAVIELCLMTVYTAQNNSICEMQGCTWGSATVYLAVAQIAFIAAAAGSIYTRQDNSAFVSRRSFERSHKTEGVRRPLQRHDVSLELW